jgi:hypothetical protein
MYVTAPFGQGLAALNTDGFAVSLQAFEMEIQCAPLTYEKLEKFKRKPVSYSLVDSPFPSIKDEMKLFLGWHLINLECLLKEGLC